MVCLRKPRLGRLARLARHDQTAVRKIARAHSSKTARPAPPRPTEPLPRFRIRPRLRPFAPTGRLYRLAGLYRRQTHGERASPRRHPAHAPQCVSRTVARLGRLAGHRQRRTLPQKIPPLRGSPHLRPHPRPPHRRRLAEMVGHSRQPSIRYSIATRINLCRPRFHYLPRFPSAACVMRPRRL